MLDMREETLKVNGECDIDGDFVSIKVERAHVFSEGNDLGYKLLNARCPKSAALKCKIMDCPLVTPCGEW